MIDLKLKMICSINVRQPQCACMDGGILYRASVDVTGLLGSQAVSLHACKPPSLLPFLCLLALPCCCAQLPCKLINHKWGTLAFRLHPSMTQLESRSVAQNMSCLPTVCIACSYYWFSPWMDRQIACYMQLHYRDYSCMYTMLKSVAEQHGFSLSPSLLSLNHIILMYMYATLRYTNKQIQQRVFP